MSDNIQHIAENNIKWHIAYGLDLLIAMPGRSIHSRLNAMSFLVSAISALCRDYYVQKQRDEKRYWFLKLQEAKLQTKLEILRNNFMPMIETDPFLMTYRASYESAMDSLMTDILFVINQNGMSGGYAMNPGSTAIGQLKMGEA